jgi:hypothetical protein
VAVAVVVAELLSKATETVLYLPAATPQEFTGLLHNE